jgi:hypothetical protein
MNEQNPTRTEKPDETSQVHYGLPKEARFPKWLTAIILLGILSAIIIAIRVLRG